MTTLEIEGRSPAYWMLAAVLAGLVAAALAAAHFMETHGHVVTGIAMCLTVIGIPLGLANFKLVPVSLLPLGKDVV